MKVHRTSLLQRQGIINEEFTLNRGFAREQRSIDLILRKDRERDR